jgi:hypothetical protein
MGYAMEPIEAEAAEEVHHNTGSLTPATGLYTRAHRAVHLVVQDVLPLHA